MSQTNPVEAQKIETAHASTKVSAPNQSRYFIWTGVILSLLGTAAYPLLLTQTEVLHIPWYAPVFATVGALLILFALTLKVSWWRILLLILFGGFAGLQWWLLLSYTRLPSYSGDLLATQRFPEFKAVRADGSPFTQNHLSGKHHTLLLFFRGHW